MCFGYSNKFHGYDLFNKSLLLDNQSMMVASAPKTIKLNLRFAFLSYCKFVIFLG
jgi:hypothetical protein